MDTELRQTMQEEHLRSMPDLYRMAKKFQRKTANLEDVIRAYQASTRLPGILGTLDGIMDEKYKDPLDAEYTKKLQECNNSLGKLQEMVETTVDLDAIDNHEYIIKADFDDGLKIIKKKLDKAKYEIEVEHRRAGKDLGQDIEKKLFLENHRVHGWCFRLTRGVRICLSTFQPFNLYTEQSCSQYIIGSWMYP
jgi:DNA mismatch repair protein MSH2